MSDLKVLIIGGGVTGLTLAAIFERYGIEYALLEKHADVTPAIGASIGLLPHGSRVLDQLGCFEELLPFGNGIENMDWHNPEGKKIGCHVKLGTHMESMLGYRIFFVERHRLLNALWGAIRDKSKVHLSCSVAKIEHNENGVSVETRDGRVFTGDFVVGADGVHSMSRDEMWRLAEADGHDLTTDRKAIKGSRSCLFGISHGLSQVKSTDAWRACRQDRHYLICAAPNGLTFWFCFFKNRKHATSYDALRYTEEEKEQYAADFSTDQTRPDVTLADLYRTSTTTGLVPIEEFVLNRYFHKRILLLGDSLHKMHPITGQGGNAAIEDCAGLANRLQDLLRRGQTPTYPQLQDIFYALQEERRPRTEKLTHGARGLARLESFGTPLLKLVMLHIFPLVPCENILAGIADSMTPGQALTYLPFPQRAKRLVPYDDEVTVAPKLRSATSSYAWILLFLLAGTLRHFVPRASSTGPDFTDLGTQSSSSTWQQYEARTYFCINAVWTIESYRAAFDLGPLLTPIPWLMLSQYIGWDSTLSIYLSLWILGTRFRGFYHPWPRVIPQAAADALPIAVPVALWGTFMLKQLPSFGPSFLQLDSRASSSLVLCLLTSLLSYFFKRSGGPSWVPSIQWGSSDIKPISRFFSLVFVDVGFCHMGFVKDNLIPALRDASAGHLTDEVLRFETLLLVMVLWLLFTVWDLRRVNVVDWSLSRAALYIFAGFAFVGPGATLVAAWWVREKVWERSRHRISESRSAGHAGLEHLG
ncbi:hypothetical protein BJY01DRAFT_175948 [Aspergillus pseudoustus]|uniref:FAD-binding domain-containing protein n=1 Tax=Aspergillus pseudoustus TaxID=1810923 RepID=A0ABR4K356_9EURO